MPTTQTLSIPYLLHNTIPFGTFFYVYHNPPETLFHDLTPLNDLDITLYWLKPISCPLHVRANELFGPST